MHGVWAHVLHRCGGVDDIRARDPRRPPRDATPQRLLAFLIVGGALAGGVALLSVQCASGPPHAGAYATRTLPPQPEQRILPAEGPDDDYFPCSDCHEDEPTNRRVRTLEDDHDDIELGHGDLWCLHCHDADDRDRLHLADGRRVAFEDSWRLCVQCHGHKQEPWRAGVHGKRVGHWWGAKEVWTCVSCHGPHAPAFQPIEPEPPPARPQEIRLRISSRSEEDHRE
jgi:hypothetical protein